jgi:hypothetical protein
VIEDSTRPTKKLADFETEARHFDSILEELQDSLYHAAHMNEQNFEVYAAAQSVRDFLFIIVRKNRGIPDPTDLMDFVSGGKVLRIEE